MKTEFYRTFAKEIDSLSHSEDERTVVICLYKIGNSGYPEAESYLLKFLDSPDARVQIICIQLLAQNRFAGLLEALPEWISNVNSPILFSNLVNYAIEMRASNIESAILGKLSNDESMIRYDAMRAIGELGFKSAIPLLLSMRTNQEVPRSFFANGELRSMADKTLGEMAEETVQKISQS